MDIKLEGRQVELGDELRERVESRFKELDKKYGPIAHSRVSVERKPHKNEQRAEVTMVVNLSGETITVSKEAATVVAAVNETLETLTLQIQSHVDKHRKEHRA
ncbi:MAG: ribosome-associated translation inhibitor RaiA [Magnetococcales bacterium]|nr:ribosome-associated translation inhibitor RaiA [Magnetococcales bacterium]